MDYIYDKNQGYTHSPHRLFVLVCRFDFSCPDHRYAPTIARTEAWCEETGSSLCDKRMAIGKPNLFFTLSIQPIHRTLLHPGACQERVSPRA